MSLSIADFLDLRKHYPVVDVRSPLEFGAGHIPGACNIPLLNNEERVVVGTTYKQQGQEEAIKAGFRLVGPRLPDIIAATREIAPGNEVLVHCWRGGMRSNNFCRFVEMANIKTQSLEDGYKAYRHEALESYKKPFRLTLLTGCTGSGKSEILRALAVQGEQIIDLEQLASHKGSAFGGLLMAPQPSTEQFQNALFEEILKLDLSKRIWVEDESLAIGKIFLPNDLWNSMSQSPLVQIDLPRETRIQRLVTEYGPADRQEFLEMMGKIVKKLGGQHYQSAKESLLMDDMAAAIDILLSYYDKAYLESIAKRKDRIRTIIPWDGRDANAFARELRTGVEVI